MRYHCHGTGRPLLLLAPGVEPERFMARHRVIVPELPSQGTREDMVVWLSAFLDGLGAWGLTVIAGESFSQVASELAALDADRVVRVLPVPSAGGD
jgi:hypothetical protein